MESPDLADFLRSRREAMQPEDVGLPRGPRRRVGGLRREEVAELAGMSTDYYARLERGNGPQPSEQMAAAIARGLRLSLAERDRLFLLTGHSAPKRVLRGGIRGGLFGSISSRKSNWSASAARKTPPPNTTT